MRHGLKNIWICANKSLDRKDQEKESDTVIKEHGYYSKKNFLNKEKQKYRERL